MMRIGMRFRWVLSGLFVASCAVAAPVGAIQYATPACPMEGGCVVMFPPQPNSAVETLVYFAIYSGMPGTTTTLVDPVIAVANNIVQITSQYSGGGAGFPEGKPPPKVVQMWLPVLSPGSYSLELRLAPDPSISPPPVQTSDGTFVPNAGIFMTSTFTVVPGVINAKEPVIEYYYPPFDHYFLTADANEIALLDARMPPFQDWVRTGESFNAFVSDTAASDTSYICRFYNDSFQGKSSHFYAAQGLGCEETQRFFPDWKLETPDAFNAYLPAASGVCQAGTIPLYRAYNNNMGGAPNHRFMTSLEVRQDMITAGWIPEGNGIGVAMCVPQ